MARQRLDEVLIVNPHDPSRGFAQVTSLGSTQAMFGRSMESAPMGYFSEVPGHGLGGYGMGAHEPVGYYAADPLAGYGETLAGYGEPYYGEYPLLGEYPSIGEYPMMGQYPPQLGGYGYAAYGEPPYTYGELPFGEPMYGYGAYAQPPSGMGEPYADVGEYGEYVGDYGDYADVGDFGEYAEYGADYGDYGDIAEAYGDMSHMHGYGAGEMVGYGDAPGMSGYVRDVPSPHNAGCPLPTNVNGLEGVGGLEGYQRPRDVSPRVTSFTSPEAPPPAPEAFRPLW